MQLTVFTETMSSVESGDRVKVQSLQGRSMKCRNVLDEDALEEISEGHYKSHKNVHNLGQFYLKGIHGVGLHTKSDGSSSVKNVNKELEIEVQTLPTVRPLHTWPITVLNGSDCQIVCFRKLPKLLDLSPSFSTGGRVCLKHMKF